MLSKKKKVEGGVRETINHKEIDIREKQQFLSHSAKVISIHYRTTFSIFFKRITEIAF